MIVVTGTKRSGTSLWMQILVSAGLPHFGEAFPRNWGDAVLRQANEEGFYESELRSGVYFATNPHPQSGAYLFSEQVERHAVKIFVPGVVRTERAFLGRVVATMREWREYEASVQRLYALEVESNPHPEARPRPHMTPALEWWWENFMLVRDVSRRGYAIHMQSYDGLLADPERVVTDTIRWIGHGDPKAATAAVKRQHRHFDRPTSTSVEPDVAAVFDEFYARVHERSGLPAAFVRKLNETNERLLPLIEDDRRRFVADIRALREEARAPAGAYLDIDVTVGDDEEPTDDES
jgi:hypothetical protein